MMFLHLAAVTMRKCRASNQPLQTDRGDKLRLPRLLNGKPVGQF